MKVDTTPVLSLIIVAGLAILAFFAGIFLFGGFPPALIGLVDGAVIGAILAKQIDR